MKHLRKVFTLALALMVILSMATLVSANSIDDAGTGSITVENPLDGETYTAYLIFDVTYGGSAYAYTIAADSEWLGAVQGYNGITLSDLLTDGDNNSFYNVTKNGNFNAAGFAAALKAAAAGKTGTALTGDTTVSASNLPLGYYFVSSTNGALCNLTTTNPTVTIRDKNDMPFEKVADDTSVEVGQTVTYTVTGKVPDTTGFTSYTYQVSDTMSAGLTFQEDVAVTIGGATVTVTPTYANNGFTLDIAMLNGNGAANYTAGAEIKITYSAIVNENAISKIEENEAVLKYSNDPANSSTTTETPPQTVKVYTAKIVIDKVDAANTSTKLDGAEFVLMNADGEYYFWNATDKKVEWKTAQADATVVTTDANGAGSFNGLEDGEYKLKEIKAPAGYNLLEDPVTVTINGSTATEENLTTLTVNAEVKNNTGSTLPETGGMGTTVFYAVGGILVVAAVVLLVTKKRMSAQ